MKIQSQHVSSVLSSRGAGRSSTFGIAASSHMFQMLSSGLYSDKVSAVLREVGCNAYDAHIAAGIESTPIEVKLPTELDRTFYIKDWGLGLDDDEITAIYAVYGVSTKQSCTEQTGGFGLGSKSPFAYTLSDVDNPDGFTVVSAKNGSERTYVAHLNDEGAPVVTLLNERPSTDDWPQGVKVMFPVRDRDFSEFRRKAYRIFSHFNVTPRILGETQAIKKATCQYQINDIAGFYLEYPDGSLEPHPNVVMANVCYPISMGHLEDVSDEERSILRALSFRLPNGSVSLTPSRESLQYTESTIATLKTHISKATQDMIASFERVLNDALSSTLTTGEKLAKFDSDVKGFPHSIRRKVMNTFLANTDETAHAAKTFLGRWGAGLIEVPTYVGATSADDSLQDGSSAHRCRVWEYRNFSGTSRRSEITGGRFASSSRRAKDNVPFINYQAKNVIIYDEPGVTYALARVKDYVETNLTSISRYSRTLEHDRVFFISTQDTSAKEHARALASKWSEDESAGFDGIEVIGISEIELPVHLRPTSKDSTRTATTRTKWDDTKAKLWDLSRGLNGAYQYYLKHSELMESHKFFINYDSRDADYVEICPQTGEILHTLSRVDALTLLRGLRLLAAKAGLSAEGVVIIENRNKATLNRYLSRGFKPFLSTAISLVEDNWELVTADINPLKPLNLENPFAAKRLGIMGQLARLKRHTPALWNAVKPTNPLSRVNKEVDAICHYCATPLTDDELDMSSSLRMVANSVKSNSNGIPLSQSIYLSTDYISRRLTNAYPAMSIVKLSFLDEIHSDNFLKELPGEWEPAFSNTQAVALLKAAILMIDSATAVSDTAHSVIVSELLAVTSPAQQKSLGLPLLTLRSGKDSLQAA